MILEKWNEEAKQTVKGFSDKEMERLDAIIAMHIMVCILVENYIRRQFNVNYK